jgi:uncharacterized protein (UPF0262 family)
MLGAYLRVRSARPSWDGSYASPRSPSTRASVGAGDSLRLTGYGRAHGRSRARPWASLFYGWVMAKIADFRLDEATWTSGTDERRRDWSVLLRELVAHGEFAEALAGRYLLATPSGEHLTIEALDENGTVVHREQVAWKPLQGVIAEYVAIIEQLDGAGRHRATEWFATLDMGKKVVHDRAAATLLQNGIGASSEKATLRGLFSLLFALRVDAAHVRHASSHRNSG